MKILELTHAPMAELVGDTEAFRKFVASIGGELLRPDDDHIGFVVRVATSGEHVYVQPDDWLVCWRPLEFSVMDEVSFRRRFNVRAEA